MMRLQHIFINRLPDGEYFNNSKYPPLFQPTSSIGKSIRALAGLQVVSSEHANIDVLWLSEDVFVTWMNFILLSHDHDHIHLFDCEIRIHEFCFCAYSLAVLKDHEQLSNRVASAVPLQFFHHLAAQVPRGSFRDLQLTRGSPFSHWTTSTYFFPSISQTICSNPPSDILS
jgi:hypothetical protein